MFNKASETKALDRPVALPATNNAILAVAQPNEPAVTAASRFDYSQYEPNIGADLKTAAASIRASKRKAQTATYLGEGHSDGALTPLSYQKQRTRA